MDKRKTETLAIAFKYLIGDMVYLLVDNDIVGVVRAVHIKITPENASLLYEVGFENYTKKFSAVELGLYNDGQENDHIEDSEISDEELDYFIRYGKLGHA